MKPRLMFTFVVAVALLSVGCTAPAPTAPGTASTEAVELHVFAAASLTEAFSEIGAQFEAEHPGVTVVFSLAGSQQLAQQISEGAPADVFASANAQQMQAVIDAGGVISGTPQTFARNRLVVIYPQDNPAGLAALPDLAAPGLQIVFAAPEVPVGQYSLDFLDKASADPALGASYKAAVLANVVSYEANVKVVLTKVTLGEADAGLVYASDISRAEADQVGRLDIPEALNVIASYPIAATAATAHADLARAFIDLVLSAAGQAILAQHNFSPVAP